MVEMATSYTDTEIHVPVDTDSPNPLNIYTYKHIHDSHVEPKGYYSDDPESIGRALCTCSSLRNLPSPVVVPVNLH